MRSGNPIFAERIAVILTTLEKARALPGTADWFGVAKHEFKLRPPVPESELVAFESRHGVVLPEDYRQFLLLAGDGGAGPYYGIEPLAEWDYWCEQESEEPGFLASPSPIEDNDSLKQAWAAVRERDGRMRSGVIKPGAGPSDAWEQYFPDLWDWARGSMHVCDHGCTYSSRLIISGPARGRIVNVDAQGWYPPYFVRDLNFVDWYERWLDQVLLGSDPRWFGFDNAAYDP